MRKISAKKVIRAYITTDDPRKVVMFWAGGIFDANTSAILNASTTKMKPNDRLYRITIERVDRTITPRKGKRK